MLPKHFFNENQIWVINLKRIRPFLWLANVYLLSEAFLFPTPFPPPVFVWIKGCCYKRHAWKQRNSKIPWTACDSQLWGFPQYGGLHQQSGLCALTNIICLLGGNEQTRARVTTASSNYEDSLQTMSPLVSSSKWRQPNCCSCQLDFNALFFPYIKGQCAWLRPTRGCGCEGDKGRPLRASKIQPVISNLRTSTVTDVLFVLKLRMVSFVHNAGQPGWVTGLMI